MLTYFKKNQFFILFLSTVILVNGYCFYLLFKVLDRVKDDVKNKNNQSNSQKKTVINLEENKIKKSLNDILNDQDYINKIVAKVDSQNNKPQQEDKKDEQKKEDPNTNKEDDLLKDAQFKPLNKDKFPSYKEVIGMKEEKRLLEDFLDYVRHVDRYQGLGDKFQPSQGIIFYGCPGTGKTFLTRALAKESGDDISYYEISSSEFACGLIGEAPKKIRQLFKDVRNNNKRSNIKASIIFLDECEEIFKNLAVNNASNSKDLANIVNQFKSELTSYENDPLKPILLIGATNHFNKLDEAIKSRLDFHIEVKVGNLEERKQYLKLMIDKIRKNPYKQEARKYLLNVLNAKIETFEDEKKANRVLEKLLNSVVTRAARKNKKAIDVEAVQEAFEKIYCQEAPQYQDNTSSLQQSNTTSTLNHNNNVNSSYPLSSSSADTA